MGKSLKEVWADLWPVCQRLCIKKAADLMASGKSPCGKGGKPHGRLDWAAAHPRPRQTARDTGSVMGSHH